MEMLAPALKVPSQALHGDQISAIIDYGNDSPGAFTRLASACAAAMTWLGALKI